MEKKNVALQISIAVVHNMVNAFVAMAFMCTNLTHKFSI